MNDSPQSERPSLRRQPPGTIRKSNGCLWLSLIVLGCTLSIMVFIAVIALVVAAAFDGTPTIASRRLGADEAPDLSEVWASGHGHTKVVHVPLKGIILLGEGAGPWSRPGNADMALMSIRKATHDPDVSGLIIELDSGGGGITASDVIYRAILDFKEAQEGRVVVAIFDDVAASGAYYVALAADYIVAHPTTLTGSIGVLMQSLNFRELGQKIGVDDVTIKSGANKDILNPLGELSPEQHDMLQGVVDELHTRFVSLVAQHRSIPEEQVRVFADGRVFLSGKALDLGLVDRIGYWDDAVAATTELLSVNDVKVFRYQQDFSLSAFLRSAGAWVPSPTTLWRMRKTRFMYLWDI